MSPRIPCRSEPMTNEVPRIQDRCPCQFGRLAPLVLDGGRAGQAGGATHWATTQPDEE